MIDIKELFAGRTMALDRSAIPALAHQAVLMARDTPRETLAAYRTSDGSRPINSSKSGNTTVIPIVGVITPDPLLAYIFGGTSPDAIVAALRQAVADPDTRDIVLVVDSPGGDVSLITETAAEIRRVRAIKPITAIARTTMASAAYWLASQATAIVATPSATVGSIGVFVAHEDQSGLNSQMGIAVTYISAPGPKKVEGNPDQPLSDDAAAFLQRKVDTVYGTFIADIAAGRGTSAATARATSGDGRAFGASEALSRKLIDRIGTLETMLSPSGKRMTASAFGDTPYELRSPEEKAAIDEEHLLIGIACGWW